MTPAVPSPQDDRRSDALLDNALSSGDGVAATAGSPAAGTGTPAPKVPPKPRKPRSTAARSAGTAADAIPSTTGRPPGKKAPAKSASTASSTKPAPKRPAAKKQTPRRPASAAPTPPAVDEPIGTVTPPPLPPLPADVAAAAYAGGATESPVGASASSSDAPALSSADAAQPVEAGVSRSEPIDDGELRPTSDSDLGAAPELAPEPEPPLVTEPESEAEHEVVVPSSSGPSVEPETDVAPEPEAEPRNDLDDLFAGAEPVADERSDVDTPTETTILAQPADVSEPDIETDAVVDSPSERESAAEAEDAAPTMVVDTVVMNVEPLADADATLGAVGADAEADTDGAPAPALRLRGLTKTYGDTHAVESIDLEIPAGAFYGLVGPNGAGKTTTLSMIAGLLRPDGGSVEIAGIDLRHDPAAAKRQMGVLPDRLRTFDRLSGRQLLYYYGVLRGLKPAVVENRIADLARAFDLTDALGRSVSDYSAGMTKKVMLAGAMIHSPRLLVLDEPFEAVDPVSSAVILDILRAYVEHGGTVVLSSHGMDLVQRACSGVAVLVGGRVLASGTVDDVRGDLTLEERFLELAGGTSAVEGLEWLHTFSD